VLVSGTIEPLARGAARAMEAELAGRGIAVTIRICATKLEEMSGKWTGQILGEAMFGKAKARAAKRLAEEKQLDLTRCYAYGDSVHDRWLLAAVGRSTAVNPSSALARVARKHNWTVLRWNKEKELTQRAQRSQRSEKISNNTSVKKSVLRRAERCV
jgi:phosphoserine phosphatase